MKRTSFASSSAVLLNKVWRSGANIATLYIGGSGSAEHLVQAQLMTRMPPLLKSMTFFTLTDMRDVSPPVHSGPAGSRRAARRALALKVARPPEPLLKSTPPPANL